ncbi:hypothetical protein BDV28DRAFT_142569 [Aspergillus coremiiformis]|uniref:Uncharacterized protein n=1 Tax=Aspergillus coremiiformis TaxID=138285 RepID=A0A5N6YW31_9EURO|nr:hypothetical protein BDV28DRAFT_142569 [Aspergillus coremiiformis]
MALDELVGAVGRAVARESGQMDYSVDGIVYLQDITDANATKNADENLAVFMGLLTSAYRDNVVVVTTFWDLLGTPEEGVRVEAELRKVYEHVASMCRVQDSSDGESYRNIISDLVSKFADVKCAECPEDDTATPTIEELLSTINDKDKQMVHLETELQATKDASARQLRDVQREAAEEKARLYQQLQDVLREVNQLKEDLCSSQQSCINEMRYIQERLNPERRGSNVEFRDLETQRSGLPGHLDELCQDMIPARSYTRNPPYQTYCSKWQASNLNVHDANGEFPLYSAAAAGRYDDVKQMLEQGANPSMRTRFHWTALHWAVGNGHTKVAQLLLDYGAEANAFSDTGRTPLSMAQTDMMRDMLQQRGAR